MEEYALVHCMDLPIQKGKEGYIGLRDFLRNVNRLVYRKKVLYITLKLPYGRIQLLKCKEQKH